MNGYGTKGGTGATAGRKAETIVAVIAGFTFKKRVFFGQRFIAVCEREEWGRPIVTAWHSQEEAEQMDENYRKSGCEFHGWASARAQP